MIGGPAWLRGGSRRKPFAVVLTHSPPERHTLAQGPRHAPRQPNILHRRFSSIFPDHRPYYYLRPSSPSPNRRRGCLCLDAALERLFATAEEDPFPDLVATRLCSLLRPASLHHSGALDTCAIDRCRQSFKLTLREIGFCSDGRYNICISVLMDHQPGAPGAAPPNPGQFDATALSRQFEQLLRSRRLNELAERDHASRPSTPSSYGYHPPTPSYQQYPGSPRTPHASQLSPRPSNAPPPSYSSYRSLPIVPSPPQDAASLKFRNLLITLSVTPTKYENPGLLDEALTHIPTERIYAEADEEHNIMLASAASMGDNVKPEWGYQDCVIKSLLRYV